MNIETFKCSIPNFNYDYIVAYCMHLNDDGKSNLNNKFQIKIQQGGIPCPFMRQICQSILLQFSQQYSYSIENRNQTRGGSKLISFNRYDLVLPNKLTFTNLIE